jgi:hypothetical protein
MEACYPAPAMLPAEGADSTAAACDSPNNTSGVFEQPEEPGGSDGDRSVTTTTARAAVLVSKEGAEFLVSDVSRSAAITEMLDAELASYHAAGGAAPRGTFQVHLPFSTDSVRRAAAMLEQPASQVSAVESQGPRPQWQMPLQPPPQPPQPQHETLLSQDRTNALVNPIASTDVAFAAAGGKKRKAREAGGERPANAPPPNGAVAALEATNNSRTWTTHYSEKSKEHYWYNSETQESHWVHPDTGLTPDGTRLEDGDDSDDESTTAAPKRARVNGDEGTSAPEGGTQGDAICAHRSEEESDYEVDHIVDKRRTRSELEYRVRWKGYGAEDDTWEPLENLDNGRAKIKKFEKKLKTAQARSQASARGRSGRGSHQQWPRKEPTAAAGGVARSGGPRGAESDASARTGIIAPAASAQAQGCWECGLPLVKQLLADDGRPAARYSELSDPAVFTSGNQNGIAKRLHGKRFDSVHKTTIVNCLTKDHHRYKLHKNDRAQYCGLHRFVVHKWPGTPMRLLCDCYRSRCTNVGRIWACPTHGCLRADSTAAVCGKWDMSMDRQRADIQETMRAAGAAGAASGWTSHIGHN